MPLAVTHILIPIILVDLVRDHVFKLKKQSLPNKYVLIAGLAGLLPDIDIPLSLILFGNVSIHRMITHTIWVPLLFFIGFLISYSRKKQRLWKIFLMFFIGISIHIILDVSLSGYASLFFPLSDKAYGFNFLPTENAWLFYSSMDAILLFGWLIHEELEHKISDYF